jgi:hypothetical protein
MALTTVRSTGIGSLPAISGANLTSLNASNISSGTLNSARFSGGAFKHISTTNVNSSTASIEFTGLTSYQGCLLIWSDVHVDSTTSPNSRMGLRIGTSGGTFETGSTYYMSQVAQNLGSAGLGSAEYLNTTFLRIADSIGDDDTNETSGHMWIFGLGEAKLTRFTYSMTNNREHGGDYYVNSGGYSSTSTAYDRVKIILADTSNNITGTYENGYFSMYGLETS